MQDPLVDTRRHVWTEMSITPVEVLGLDDDGEPVIVSTEDPEVGVGCFACDIGLTAENMDSECEGEQDAGHLS